MGEEAKKEVIAQDTVNEVTDLEQQARDSGWVSQDSFEGPEEEFVDYPEFVRRGELYSAIHKSNRKSKKLEEQITLLTEHNKKTADTAYKKALADLKKEKLVAAEDGDVKRIIEIDDEIDDVREQQKTVETITPTNDPYAKWVEKNSDWYEENDLLTDFAIGYGGRVERAHPEWTQDQVLEDIEKTVKEKFPEKFGNPNREKPNKVSSNSNGGKPSKKKQITFNDLPEEGKAMYKKLVKSKTNPHGSLSSEQYLKDYALNSGQEWED